MANSSNFKFEFDFASMEKDVDKWTADFQKNARSAVQSGVQLIYDEALRLVPVASKPTRYKGRTYAPGRLKAAIYQVYSADNSNATKVEYHISWNKRKAPHGHLIEFGHWTKKVGKYGPLQPTWVPPKSFIRAAFERQVIPCLTTIARNLTIGIKR